MARTESSSQGYRLAAASLPCPRRSFGTFNKGAEPTLCAERRLARIQGRFVHLKFTRIGLGAETPCLPCQREGDHRRRRWWKDSLRGREHPNLQEPIGIAGSVFKRYSFRFSTAPSHYDFPPLPSAGARGGGERVKINMGHRDWPYNLQGGSHHGNGRKN